jgi:hypothetical protein
MREKARRCAQFQTPEALKTLKNSREKSERRQDALAHNRAVLERARVWNHAHDLVHRPRLPRRQHRNVSIQVIETLVRHSKPRRHGFGRVVGPRLERPTDVDDTRRIRARGVKGKVGVLEQRVRVPQLQPARLELWRNRDEGLLALNLPLAPAKKSTQSQCASASCTHSRAAVTVTVVGSMHAPFHAHPEALGYRARAARSTTRAASAPGSASVHTNRPVPTAVVRHRGPDNEPPRLRQRGVVSIPRRPEIDICTSSRHVPVQSGRHVHAWKKGEGDPKVRRGRNLAFGTVVMSRQEQ